MYTLPLQGNRLVSGWQISEILSVAAGFPVNVMTGLTPTESNTLGLTGDRPEYSGAAGCHPNHIVDVANYQQKIVQWFDPSCYVVQPFGTLGNVPRDSLTGPGLLGLDFSVIKQTRVTEKLNAEFRAEFFNIINHANFGQPPSAVFAGSRGSVANNDSQCLASPATCTAYTSGTAGVITSTATTSRQIQFALKLIF